MKKLSKPLAYQHKRFPLNSLMRSVVTFALSILCLTALSGCSSKPYVNSTPSTVTAQVIKPVKPLPAEMCLLPENIAADYYGDYPEKALPAIILALAATNKHNRSINKVNGASE